MKSTFTFVLMICSLAVITAQLTHQFGDASLSVNPIHTNSFTGIKSQLDYNPSLTETLSANVHGSHLAGLNTKPSYGYGGSLQYDNKKIQSAASIQHNLGTKPVLDASIGGVIWRPKPNSQISLQGTYQQPFGGQPNFGAGAIWKF